MKESKDGKEMLGGCCVCSDDRGWTENPLVYCDGQGCNVAVHQACYGIVAVPSGPWFCRKCESQERAARVRCELCPSKDGALKRTDSSSVAWAHVVCALYIPEVRFGNVTTMEPIILSMVPQDRFNKSCYICEGQGREAKSKLGACMNCNKAGCKHHFHVTCAQAMGLLCEEAGNYQDNVKYCGYCQHHYSKLKKGSNVKTIPAFKPVPPIGAPSESNPSDKFTAIQAAGSSWGGQPPSGASNGSKEKQRKKPGRKSGSQVFPKAGNSRDSTSSSVIVEGPNAGDDSKMKKNEANPMYPNVLAGVGLVPGPRATMSDQCSSGADRHESSDSSKQENARNSETTKASGMKKNEKSMDGSKHSGSITSGAPSVFPELLPSVTSITDKSRTARRKGSTRSASPTSQGGNDTESTLSNVSDLGLASAPEASVVGEQCKGQPPIKYETPAASENNSSMGHSVIVSSASAHHSESSSTQVQSSLAVPQRAISPLIISTSAGSSQSQNQAKLNYNNMFQNAGKELVASATPAKKARRGRTPKVTAPVVPDSPPSSPDSAEHAPKRRKKATKSAATAFDDRHELSVAVNRAEDFLSAHLNQHAPTTENVAKKESASIHPMARENLNASKAPASLPAPSPMPANNVGTKDLNSYKDSSAAGKENNLYLRNGLAVPHMLGNQLNPNSSVAQQLTDTLAAEVEAHSITNQPSPISSNSFTGVPFPVRPVSPSLKMNLPSGSATSAVPQTMEQLLERQWEHGSQFLMGQAQQFDIASLLSCLHNLRQENMRLEDQVADLKGRRDRLLVVHARLSVPLAVQSSHMAFTSTSANLLDRSTPVPGHPAGHALRASPQERERNNRGTPYLPQMENGIGLSEHLSAFTGTAFSSPHGSHRSSASSSHQNDRVIPSPVIVSSRSNPVYHPVPSVGAVSVPSTMSPVQGASSFMSAEGRNLTVLRSPSSTPEMRPEIARNTAASSQQQQQSSYGYQIVSPPLSVAPHHPGSYANMVTTMTNANQLNARREGSDSRHPIGRPSPIERR